MVAKFLRRTWNRYSKLGKRRKKKQIWRRPTGRDNKMREKRKGYPCVVSVGYQTDKTLKNQIKEKNPVQINNITDLEMIKKNEIGIVGNIGKKKKIEIAKKAKEKGVSLYNLNAKTFLKQNGKKKVEKKVEDKKKKIEEKKSEKKETEEKKTGENKK